MRCVLVGDEGALVEAQIESSHGGSERLRFLEGPNGDLYHWATVPPDARSCVIMCSSILGEFDTNYHRERLLAAELASLGHAVVRFHYAGDGNSGGRREDLTLGSMCTDAEAVLAEARMGPFDRFGMVGTRVGAVVAAKLAQHDPRSPVALWEPVARTRKLMREGMRRKKMASVAQREVVSRAVTIDPSNPGPIDLLGYDVHPPLVESLTDFALGELLQPATRPVLLVRFATASAGSDRVAEELDSQGFDLHRQSFDLTESWWFQSELEPPSGGLLDSTAQWMDRALRASEGDHVR